MPDRPRTVLLHATSGAVSPVGDALTRLWADAETTNLLDDGPTSERGRTAQLGERLIQRFGHLVGDVDSTEPDGMLTRSGRKHRTRLRSNGAWSPCANISDPIGAGPVKTPTLRRVGCVAGDLTGATAHRRGVPTRR